MAEVCIDQHSRGMSLVFIDSSMYNVFLKNLWNLKQHKEYELIDEIKISWFDKFVKRYNTNIFSNVYEMYWNKVITVARIESQVIEASEFWENMIGEVCLYDQILSSAEMTLRMLNIPVRCREVFL